MMTEELVSVVMPAFNCETYISQAISSILEQDYRNIELIIINDGSTDGTGEVISRFSSADPRIKVVTRANKGLVASLNEGISLARGKLVARMDADDISMPFRIRKQTEHLDSHPEISILGGQAIQIDMEGKRGGGLRKPTDAYAIEQFLKYGCPVIHPTYMVRKEVYEHLGGYRDLMASEDIDFLVRAHLANYVIANLSQNVLFYRTNPAGMSSRNAFVQMRNTRRILSQIHKGRQSDKAEITAKKSEEIGSSMSRRWFEFWWKTRIKLLSNRESRNRQLTALGVLFCSLMHYELLLASYRAARSLRWKGKHLVNHVLAD
ncbi:glycosyltransferase family 2 protein [Thiohalomonas denitrificans]|uniref:Glycosyl transferase family 2 n=1 Tax=Thiohalomonas denitrificans TaxID=415747 RepID=A0A1G5QZJ6_9GAMM|nr:glycosyltransferase [Thiohalomonas denitrificans]SCZ67233.1 Glycosyl transferase family 2 [Thiohalomonas denitrificans]